MDTLILIKPSIEYAEQINEYRQEFVQMAVFMNLRYTNPIPIEI